MSTSVVQVVDASGEICNTDPSWFPSDITDATAIEYPVMIAILGPQASGKSTLANSLFDTEFPVAARTSVATGTTRGILVAHPPGRPEYVIFDVEGADARERGREGKAFQARCASFVANIADVIVLNMWYHDTCRMDSAGYVLLKAVLLTCAQVITDVSTSRTALVFTIRDIEDDVDQVALEELVRTDVGEIWSDVAVEAGLPAGGSPLEEYIDFSVLMLPHIRHNSNDFDQEVGQFRNSLYGGKIASAEHSKRIPADGLSAYARSLWESVALSPSAIINNGSTTRDTDNFYGGEDYAIVAAYHCDEVFSEKLTDASTEIADLLEEVESGSKINSLGTKGHAIISKRLQEYDAETAEFVDEPVCERKRRELEAIMDTALMSVYMKNIAICAREALASFKSSISSEVPTDYAIYHADSQFVSAAKEGIRPGSSWSYETERTDLKNMMNEIALQQKKLLDTQLNASVQHSKAIQFLRIQQAQMQAVQQQALGGAVGQWNLGAAYRPPDSNVNVSLGYQQGRTNVQVSMVPDESTSLLGPTGFTAGVGPGNLGLSFNVNF